MKIVCLSVLVFAVAEGRRGSNSAPLAPLSPHTHFGGYPYYGWFLDDLADENMAAEHEDSKKTKEIKRGKDLLSYFGGLRPRT